MASQLQQISDQAPPRRGLHLKEITSEGVNTDSLGGLLRQARLRKGADLKAASHSTKIKTEYLEALEEGKADALPGRAYALGFVRAYAQFLGLDPADCVTRFKSEHAPPVAEPEPVLGFDEKEVETGGLQVSGTVIILIGLVILGLVWGGIYLFRSANDSMDRRGHVASPGVHTAPVAAAPTATTAPATPGTEEAAASGTPASGASDTADTTPVAGTVAPTKSESVAQDLVPPAEGAVAAPANEPPAASAAKPPAAAPAETKPAASGTATATTPAAAPSAEDTSYDKVTAAAPRSLGGAAEPGRLLLRATDKVFVRIATTGPRQEVVYQGQLSKGDVFYVPAKDNLVLVTRNGGALDIYVDKALKGPVGPKGVALSGMPLTPESFQR